MKDFPVFTTDNGVASLTLKEIPYTKTAYIKIQSTLEPEKLVAECVEFCKMAGAEHIYGSNHPYLEKYPFHTQILRMISTREALPDTDAALFPVTEQTIDNWREIYNNRMSNVPNFSYMTSRDGQMLLEQGNGYYIHRGDELLGIGMASGEKMDTVIAVKPGAGEDVVLALNHALSGEQIQLEVASTNEKAVNLYRRMGFITAGAVSSWYRLL